jgi:tetratricopeptide (TPR) repeat protein
MVDKRINLTEALQMIRKAVELKPNDGYIVDSLGWAHYQLREYDEAVKNLERAVELRPEDPIINEHLGDAYWRAGRKLEARFQWQHAKDNKPEKPDLEEIQRKLDQGMPDEPPVPATTQSDTTKTVN